MTRPLLLFTAALLALTADIARAQSPGFNLSWNDCAASLAGGLSATSACTSNTETTKNLYGRMRFRREAPRLLPATTS